MKNITPEEIKWMCWYAEGFDITHNGHAVSVHGRMSRPFDDWVNDQDWHIVCPLLLQRAIEGLSDRYSIQIVKRAGGWQWDEDVLKPFGTYDDIFFDNPDEAKLAALRYVREQEANNG